MADIRIQNVEALGKPLTLLMPERFRRAHQQGLAHVVATGQSRLIGSGTIELAGLRKDGGEFPLELTLSSWTAGQQRFFTPEMPGFYEARVGRDSRMIAANPQSAEGNLDRMPPEDLFASIQRTQGETQQAGLLAEDDKEDFARRQMTWWYFLLVALLAGIAEIYIANRRAYETKRGTAS